MTTVDASIPRETDDAGLRTALAEYELLKDYRVSYNNNASSHVGNLMVGASVSVAAVAAVVSIGGYSNGVRREAYVGVGLILLVLGILTFRRLVSLRVRLYEYDTCLSAIRTYLVRRAPAVKPYFLLPTLDDHDRGIQQVSFQSERLVAAFNGLLVGASIYTTVPDLRWARLALAILAGVLTLGAQVAYESRRMRRTTRRLDLIRRDRGTDHGSVDL